MELIALNDWKLTNHDRQTLLDIAKQSIEFGLDRQTSLKIDSEQFSERLRQIGSSFITLHLDGKLRGCIGQLEPSMSIIKDVAQHAFAAAFDDPRFPPVNHDEIVHLDIHISLLSAKEPIPFESEQELLAQLRPGEDGLILRSGSQQSTFLPTVWESLPEPKQFLSQLKIKAGLAGDEWGDYIQIWRYQTLSIP